MKGKKKNVIKVIIVLLVIGGIFYFAQPWIVYYTGPPRWTYERLCQVCKAEVIGIRHEGER